MRPFVAAMACVALLFVASANMQAAEVKLGETFFNQVVELVDGQSEAIQEQAGGIQQKCGEAAEAGVDPEIVNAEFRSFMELGNLYMLGSQLIGEGKMLAELAETDAEYLDAAKKVLLGRRAYAKLKADLDAVVERLDAAIAALSAPKEA